MCSNVDKIPLQSRQYYILKPTKIIIELNHVNRIQENIRAILHEKALCQIVLIA